MSCDYEFALKLQCQLEKEILEEEEKNNLLIAINIQQQYDEEYSLDNEGNKLYYKDKKLPKDDKKSLIDPSWEVIDPTPDIHILFMTYNEQFFWNKLLSVCVSWSKRMTSCAGVCSYSTGGLCKITLSEPLLKLRPRKDLVETLLHEMIHAFLFVTHNNKDRDGHGPEFHKHMYRINGDAGTNITVYHDFHDEVRLYKQHWWQCDGPCRTQKPFFGTVKRATNRPPGPNDFWWANHSRVCGGTFIKVKEPEKKPAKSKSGTAKKDVTVKAKDIRNYFNTNDNKENRGSNSVPSSKEVATVTTTSSSTKVQESPSSNETDYSVVRNHWLSKYNDNDIGEGSKPKRMRKEVKATEVPCPVCSETYPENLINQHLDICILNESRTENSVSKCDICDKLIDKSYFIEHLQECLNLSSDTIEPM